MTEVLIKMKLHIIFFTKRKRKIFSIPGVMKIVREEIRNACEECDAVLLAISPGIEIEEDTYLQDYAVHCIVELNSVKVAPVDLQRKLKLATAKRLLEEVQELGAMQSVWTKSVYMTDESSYDPMVAYNFIKGAGGGTDDAE